MKNSKSYKQTVLILISFVGVFGMGWMSGSLMFMRDSYLKIVQETFVHLSLNSEKIKP